MNETTLVLAIAAAIVLVVLVAGGIWLSHRRRRARMRADYASEYDAAAEKEVLRREKAVKEAEIRSLSAAERDRFSQSWRAVQKDFVDRPVDAVAEADRLVTELLRERGYPVDGRLQLHADVRTSHPELFENYRRAREIADRSRENRAGTEELRQAMVHYRSLFSSLLDEPGTDREASERTDTMEVKS